MALSVGDKVSFLNETGGGEVIALKPDNVVVVLTDDGFEMDYPAHELVGAEVGNYTYTGPGYEGVKDEQVSYGQKKLKLDHWLRKIGKRAVPVIDLHLHELLDDPSSLRNWEKLDYQLDYFKSCFYEAVDRKITTLVVVHGVGEGVLRHAIIDFLKERDNVEFFDAPMREFGSGALQIEIRGLYG